MKSIKLLTVVALAGVLSVACSESDAEGPHDGTDASELPSPEEAGLKSPEEEAEAAGAISPEEADDALQALESEIGNG